MNLPVEFDASRRAKHQIAVGHRRPRTSMVYVNKVLNAAAWTYVAGTLQSVLTLLYYVSHFAGGRDEITYALVELQATSRVATPPATCDLLRRDCDADRLGPACWPPARQSAHIRNRHPRVARAHGAIMTYNDDSRPDGVGRRDRRPDSVTGVDRILPSVKSLTPQSGATSRLSSSDGRRRSVADFTCRIGQHGGHRERGHGYPEHPLGQRRRFKPRS